MNDGTNKKSTQVTQKPTKGAESPDYEKKQTKKKPSSELVASPRPFSPARSKPIPFKTSEAAKARAKEKECNTPRTHSPMTPRTPKSPASGGERPFFPMSPWDGPNSGSK